MKPGLPLSRKAPELSRLAGPLGVQVLVAVNFGSPPLGGGDTWRASMRIDSVRSTFFATLVFASVLAASNAIAQTYPSKPVRIVVAYPPGGGADVPARIVAAAIQPTFGQQLIIENRPGASGTIGAAAVAQAAPDGYTILCTDVTAPTYAPAMYKSLPYDAGKDFVIISPIVKTALVLVAGPAWKGANLKQLVEEVKTKTSPSIGQSPSGQLATELFKARTGLNLLLVLYKGASPVLQDLVGGQISLGIVGPNSAGPLIKEGKLRAIAVTSKDRDRAFPDTPSLSEVSPDFNYISWLGMWAPAAVPRDVLARLNSEITRALNNPEVVKKFADQHLEVYPMSLSDGDKFWRSEMVLWPDVIRRAGMKAD